MNGFSQNSKKHGRIGPLAILSLKIINLSFMMDENKFRSTLEEAVDDEEAISDKKFDYLKVKLKDKKKWAKCLLKSKFSDGVSTTSRVEGLHAIQKKFLTSSS